VGVIKNNKLKNIKILNDKPGGKCKGALNSSQNHALDTLALLKNHDTH
jgi:hypothetical protein